MQKKYVSRNALFETLDTVSSSARKDVEAWVVNTVKVRMIMKLDNMLEGEGRTNARELLLVPIFEIDKLAERVENSAPELRTLFYKELNNAINTVEKRQRT